MTLAMRKQRCRPRMASISAIEEHIGKETQ